MTEQDLCESDTETHHTSVLSSVTGDLALFLLFAAQKDLLLKPRRAVHDFQRTFLEAMWLDQCVAVISFFYKAFPSIVNKSASVFV